MTKVQRTVHVLIEGRVQGVGFRAWVDLTARGLGLEGWVRNRRDGGVEAVFRGGSASVGDMLARCYSGPPAARVDRLHVLGDAADTYTGFEVLPTV